MVLHHSTIRYRSSRAGHRTAVKLPRHRLTSSIDGIERSRAAEVGDGDAADACEFDGEADELAVASSPALPLVTAALMPPSPYGQALTSAAGGAKHVRPNAVPFAKPS